MAENVVRLPTPEQRALEKVEEHLRSARTELGNAGFAALVGLPGLSVEALDVVIDHVDAARYLLTRQR